LRSVSISTNMSEKSSEAMQTQRQLLQNTSRYPLEMGILFVLAVLYLPLLVHWYDGWVNKTISIEHEYFSHGVIGLPFAAYIVWQQRHQWRRLSERTHPWGVILLVLGGILYLAGTPNLLNFSFPLVLTGICLWWKGIPGLRLQAFPLLFVWLATPNDLPYLIAPYIQPLQSFIAGVAAFILDQFAIDVTVREIYLFVGGRIVEVAPHCAGLKSLLTSIYVALMLMYLTKAWRSRWKMVAFAATAVVVSVVGNILRNTILTFLYGNQMDRLFHLFHEGLGGDLYLAAVLGVLVVCLLQLDQKIPHPTDNQS